MSQPRYVEFIRLRAIVVEYEKRNVDGSLVDGQIYDGGTPNG